MSGPTTISRLVVGTLLLAAQGMNALLQSTAVQCSSAFVRAPTQLHRQSVLQGASWLSKSTYVRHALTCQTDIAWSKVKVVENTKAAEGYHSLTIDVGGDIAADYKIPGQYVQIKAENQKPGYYAIANAPKGDSQFEFLIKDVEDKKWLWDAKGGSTLEMSPPQGKGFAIAEHFNGFKYDFPTQNVLLFATGTSIAPIRAVVESGLLEKNSEGPVLGGRSCKLYFGVQSPAKLPYLDKLKEWEANGIEVVIVMSKGKSAEWAGRTGYIQDALEKDGVVWPRNTGVLLVGQKEMCDKVREICKRAGVEPGRMLSNY